MENDTLLQVMKPARYIGEEWNVSRKNFDSANIKFALCFPDLYEVGMSNLGTRILYGLLNSVSDITCERFFACETDLEKIMREANKKMLSLESARPAGDFDVMGFSLGSELNYTNVLAILDLCGLPLQAQKRDNSHPLVIAGGPSVLNPEPMHEFFDLFLIGEAEELILEFTDTYRKNKDDYRSGNLSKQELLSMLCRIEGVYVPSFYEPRYGSGAKLEEFLPKVKDAPLKIRKRFVKDLNSSYFPKDWLVPYIQIVHDRISIEIMRGCPNTCSFCQAKPQYHPLRLRSVENIMNLALETCGRTGYEEISLAGLSVSDYPRIEELVARLIGPFKAKGISVSLPSLKAKSQVGTIAELIAGVKKTGLTFAPEAGSERLRKAIGKNFDEQEFFRILKESYISGYQHVKLYFMIGLPFESAPDLDGIIDFSVRVSELRRNVKGSPAQVNISVNTLIPKPHTALQWLAMEEPHSVRKKQEYLRDRIKNRRLKISFHNSEMGFLEGVLSRGDRRLSSVVLIAFRKGARFDAWGNHFNFGLWDEAFKEAGIEPSLYLMQRQGQELFPWDFIDTGISKNLLLDEFNKLIDSA